MHRINVYISVFVLMLIIIIAVVVNMSFNNNEYVVKVNGQGVPIDEFKVYMKIIKNEKEKSADVTTAEEMKKFWTEPVEGQDPVAFVRQEAMDSAIDMQIIMEKAQEKGIELSEQEKNLLWEKLKTQGFIDEIKDNEINEKNIKKVINNFSLQIKFYNYITRDVSITDEEFDQFVDQNPDLFKQYHVRHILFLTRDENNIEFSDEKQKNILQIANNVFQEAKDGKDFSTLAKEYSQDSGTKDSGGEFDFFMGEAVQEFEQAVMNLKPGEISEPVKTIYGYHIIKFDSVSEPLEDDLASLKKKYKDNLTEMKRQETFQKSFTQWKNNAQIEKNEELLNSININNI